MTAHHLATPVVSLPNHHDSSALFARRAAPRGPGSPPLMRQHARKRSSASNLHSMGPDQRTNLASPLAATTGGSGKPSPDELDGLETSMNPAARKQAIDAQERPKDEGQNEYENDNDRDVERQRLLGDGRDGRPSSTHSLFSFLRKSSKTGSKMGTHVLRVASIEVPLQPELIAISLVYLVQGLLGLSRLAIFTFFKDDLSLDPSTVGILTSLGAAPWVVKPLYGFLSDSVPLFGYRRRSYLVLCGALGAASWAALAGPVDTASAAVGALILGSLSTACADVVADSIVVELCRGEPQSTAGSLQSLCWGSASTGAVLSAYFSGSLVQYYGPRPVFLLTAAFPLLVAVAAVTIPEEKISYHDVAEGHPHHHTDSTHGTNTTKSLKKNKSSNGTGNGVVLPSGESAASAIRAQAKALWGALSQKSILYPTLFVFLWQATPTPDTAMLFFETNKLGFTTEFLGRIRLIASIASLLGVGVYNFSLKKVPLRKMFFWTAILGACLGLTQLALITGLNRQWGISDEVFALGDSALLTVLGQVSFMPVLVLAARLCPEGVEATLFATLMSILNGGTFVGSAFGSVLTRMFGVTATEFDNLAPLVAVCTLSALAPLAVLRLLPENVDKENKDT